jgi:hypothetical protein
MLRPRPKSSARRTSRRRWNIASCATPIRQIAEEMKSVAPSTAHKWVSAGLADIPRQTAEELRTMMMEQCNTIMQKLMPLMEETALKGRQPDSSRHSALASSMCGTGPTGTINARSRPLIPQTTVLFWAADKSDFGSRRLWPFGRCAFSSVPGWPACQHCGGLHPTYLSRC